MIRVNESEKIHAFLASSQIIANFADCWDEHTLFNPNNTIDGRDSLHPYIKSDNGRDTSRPYRA